MNVISDSPIVSSMSRHGASIMTVSPYKERTPNKIKSKKISETLIKGKESIQEPVNPIKRAKEDSIIDEKKIIKKIPPPFKNRVYYRGDTNQKTREYDNSPSDTDGCERNLGDEYI